MKREKKSTVKKNIIYPQQVMPTPLARLARALAWLPVAVVTDAVVGGPARVRGDAMAPALRSGDVVLVDRLAVRLFTYVRGNVVMMR